jgi:hypothetical protein
MSVSGKTRNIRFAEVLRPAVTERGWGLTLKGMVSCVLITVSL